MWNKTEIMQQVLNMQSISCFHNMYEEVLGVFVTCMRVSAGPLNVKKNCTLVPTLS